MLQLVDGRDGLAAHVLDGILVAQIVRALDGVEHVPVPVVRQDIGQGRVDAALGGDRVRAGRKDLGDHRDTRLGLRQLQRGAQAAAAGADDEGIEITPWQAHAPLPPMAARNNTRNDHRPQPASISITAANSVTRRPVCVDIVDDDIADTDPGMYQY